MSSPHQCYLHTVKQNRTLSISSFLPPLVHRFLSRWQIEFEYGICSTFQPWFSPPLLFFQRFWLPSFPHSFQSFSGFIFIHFCNFYPSGSSGFASKFVFFFLSDFVYCDFVVDFFFYMLWIVLVWTWTIQPHILDGSWFKWIRCKEICS